MTDIQSRLNVSGIELSLATSFQLLSPDLQKRWLELSVFPDTFDHPAAAAVWEVAPGAARDALSDLLKYSLAQWNSATDRYRLHDLVRDFTGSRLDETERAAGQAHHAAHYKGVLASADDLYLGAHVLEGLALFDLEWANIRAGQAWAAARAAQDDSAARLCIEYPDAGAWVLGLRQHPRQRIEWLAAALSSARRLKDRPAEGLTLGNLGNAYHRLGDYRRDIEFHEQALAVAREIKDRRFEGTALNSLGVAYDSLGEYHRAIGFHEQRLAIAREIGDRRGESYALCNLGNAYDALGDHRRAIEFYEPSLAIAREIGDRRGEGTALLNRALALAATGNRAQAVSDAEGALRILDQIDDPDAARVRAILAEWRKP